MLRPALPSPRTALCTTVDEPTTAATVAMLKIHTSSTSSSSSSPKTQSIPRSKGLSPTRPRRGEPPTAAGRPSAAWDSPQTMLAIQSIQRHSTDAGSTPSLSSILAAYSSDGEGDLELLKALLFAKAREDERLAAYDMMRVEQMRAANVQAAAYQQQYWLAHQQHAYAPSSPVSPQSTQDQAALYAHYGMPTIAVSTPVDGTHSQNLKRGHSLTVDDPTGKKHRSEKMSHEQIMMALRARCERNRAEAHSTSSRSRSSSSSSSSSNLAPNHQLHSLPIIATKPSSDGRSTRSSGSRAYPSPPPRLRGLDPLPTSGVLPPMSSTYPAGSTPTTTGSSRGRRSISEEATRPSSNSSTLSRLLNAVDVASAYAKTSDVRSSPGDTEDKRAVSV